MVISQGMNGTCGLPRDFWEFDELKGKRVCPDCSKRPPKKCPTCKKTFQPTCRVTVYCHDCYHIFRHKDQPQEAFSV